MDSAPPRAPSRRSWSVGDTVSGTVHLSTGPPATARSRPPPAAPTRRRGGGAGAVHRRRRATCTPRCWCSAPGPGGYTAAFRAADLGKQVVMVDRRGPLGGVCLNVGLHPVQGAAARRQGDRRDQGDDRRTGWPSPPDHRPGRAARLEGRRGQPAHRRAGRAGQAAQGHHRGRHRHVHLAEHGRGHRPDGSTSTVSFDQAIIAAGSEPVTLPFVPHDDPRVIDSTGALDLDRHPGAAAGARRRDHRAGDGHRLLRARLQGLRGGADGPAHPRRGQGPGHPAHQADHQAVRRHLAQDQGHQRRGRARTG